MVGIVKWLRPRVVAPVYVGSNPTTHPIEVVGVSPSGKATDSDSVIRRFESCYPSFESLKRLSFFMRLSRYEKNPRQYVVDRRKKLGYIGKTKIKTRFGW